MFKDPQLDTWLACNVHQIPEHNPDVNEVARVALWRCRDRWIVGYSTSRVVAGPAVGRFVTVAYEPTGQRTSTGRLGRHRMVYERAFSTRRAAKARAESLYATHCATGRRRAVSAGAR